MTEDQLEQEALALIGLARRDQPDPGLPDRAGLRRPRRAEDADRRTEFGEGAEALDELGLNAHHPPGVGVHPARVALAGEQALIGGGLLNLRLAANHRALRARSSGHAVSLVINHLLPSERRRRDQVRHGRQVFRAAASCAGCRR